MRIDPDRIYKTSDKELTDFFPVSTLAKWRHLGCGPAYMKLGKIVAYRGSDLLDWMENNRVSTSDSAA